MGIFIFDWAKILVFLNIMQVAVILIIRIVLSIRFKNRILDMLLFHPFAIVYITLISTNSYMQAKFGEGVCWKGRVYDVSEENELNLVKDNSE